MTDYSISSFPGFARAQNHTRTGQDDTKDHIQRLTVQHSEDTQIAGATPNLNAINCVINCHPSDTNLGTLAKMHGYACQDLGKILPRSYQGYHDHARSWQG